MDKKNLVQAIQAKQSFLCIGLDPELDKLPPSIQQDPEPILTFNKAVIDATADLAVAYKPNVAFYEALGSRGWDILQETLAYIPRGIFTIADAKRADIGNTARQYAKAFFETMNFDAITISPYMGGDTIEPFLAYPNKWPVILALTSNSGAEDFQKLEAQNKPLYAHVLEKGKAMGSSEDLMFVVGGTKPESLRYIRSICPDHFLLIPGIGKQGGDLKSVARNALNQEYGLLVNVGRSIIYAGSGRDFHDYIREAAKSYQQAMATFIPNE